MKRLPKMVLVLLTLVAGGVAVSMAKDDKAAKLGVGDKAPGWQALAGVDGKDHALDEYKSAKAMVLVFTCNHCPVAKAYEERLVALQHDYQDKGVQVVAICVNKGEADALDQMIVRAKDKGFNFPYVIDPTQAIGRKYGARVTPHVFVLDQDRKVAYIGAVDDNMDASAVKKHYVRDALDALLAGKEPTTKQTRPVGCGIRYE